MNLQCPTPAQIQKIYTELASLETALNSYPTKTVEERFKKYTHGKTIKALKECFTLLSKSTAESPISDILKRIETVLKERWEHIRGSFLCYTQSPQESLNALCLDIAKSLYPLPAILAVTPAAIEIAVQTATDAAVKAASQATTKEAKKAIDEATKTVTDELTKTAITAAITAAINTALNTVPKATTEMITNAAKRTARTAIKALTEIEAAIDTRLPFREGPYFLIMPSLEADKDTTDTNIHNFKTHQFVLSDNQTLFIPVASCLEMAGVSERGEFTHQVAKPADLVPTKNPDGKIITPNPYRPLSDNEKNRVAYHSEESEKYFHEIRNLLDEKETNPSLGAALKLLVADLRNGGAHATGNGKGEELNSGSSANAGIIKFAKKWNNYSKAQIDALYEKYSGDASSVKERMSGDILNPSLKELIERFIRSEKLNPKDTRYCVELTANDLDRFIKNYNDQLFTEPCSAKVVVSELSVFIKNVTTADGLFKKAIEQPNYSVKPGKNLGRLPALLLSESDTEQQKILGKVSPNFLLYGLLNPELIDNQILLEAFEKLPTTSQKKLIHSRVNTFTALIIAVQQRNPAFVNALIKAGAEINAQTAVNDTALNWAVFQGSLDLVRLLLDSNADLTIRGYDELNPLEMALKYGATPELISELCVKIFNSSSVIQANILVRVPGNYTDIFTWAFNTHPATISALHALPNSNLTAKLTTLYNDQALIKTISKGHQAPILKALIAANPGIKTTTEAGTGNTPLMVAAINKNQAAMELLLAENSDLTVRNNNNENILEVVIKQAPEFLPQLALKIFNTSTLTQKNLFSRFIKEYELWEWAFVASQADTLSALVSSHKAEIISRLKNKYEKQTLIKATENGHKAPLIRTLITDPGLNINEKDPQQDTALTQAATHANAAAMQLLLEHNADMTLRNSNGDNVFDIVLKKEPKLLLKELCITISSKPEAEQKQILEKQGQGKYNHIFCWAFDNNPAVALALLELTEIKESEMAAKIKALHKDMSLILAVEKGYLSLIPFLGTPDIINFKVNETAIMRAVSLGNKEALELLLVQKPDLSITNPDGDNALNIALKKDKKLLPLLLTYIATHTVEQRKKILAKFSLHQAINTELNGFVQALLDIGVDINLPDTDKNTPIMKTTILKSSYQMQLILAKNPDLTPRNKAGKNILDLTLELIKKPDLTPQLLLKIAERYSFSVQKELLSKIENGRYNNVIDYIREKYPKELPAILALPNIQKLLNNGLNLVIALKKGEIAKAQSILAEDPNIDSQDTEGDTALICTIRQNNPELTKFILTKNPDLTHRNKAGVNALDLAVKNAPKLIGSFLEKIGSYTKEKKKEALSKITLSDAIKMGNQALISALIDSGVCVDIWTTIFGSPAIITALSKNRPLMQLLLTKSPNLKPNKPNGLNVLNMALASNNASRLIPDLLNHGAATLTPQEQQNLLSKIEKGRYKTILSYAKAKHPQHVASLLLLPNVQAGIKKATENLIPAVKAGKLEEVKDCIDNNADINVQDPKKDTPLIWAIHDKHMDIAQYLLSLNPDLTIRNTIAGTENAFDIALRCLPKLIPELITKITTLPIAKQREIFQNVTVFQAMTFNHLPLVQSIINQDNVDSKDTNKDSTFMLAIKNKNPNIARALLTYNPNLTLRNKQGENALELALIHTPELIEDLVTKISTYSAEDQQEIIERITLYSAVKTRSLPFVKLLVTNGVELNDAGKEGLRALIFASFLDNTAIATYLSTLTPHANFRNGFDTNVVEMVLANTAELLPQFINKIAKKSAEELKELSKNVTLFQAVAIGYLPLIQTVLANNPNMTLRNSKGDNVLDIALAKAPELVPELLIKMVNLTDKAQQETLIKLSNGRYKSILSYARKYHPQIMPTLLKNAQTVALEASAKLINAIEKHTLNLTDLIKWVADGANINARTRFNDTALQLAVYLNKPDIVHYLLEKNADMTIRNQHHENVLDIGVNRGSDLVPSLLLKMATRPINEQKSLLERTAYRHIFDYIQNLYPLSLVAFLDLPNIKSMDASEKLIMLGGSHALLKAATNGPAVLVQVLINAGADVDIQDQDGNTPLTLAATKGQEEISRVLLGRANSAIRNNKGESILTLSPPQFLKGAGLTDMTGDLKAANRHLNALGFDNQIAAMKEKIKNMPNKEHYRLAITEATTLVNKLEDAKLMFLRRNNLPGHLMEASNVQKFKSTCIKALKDASPVLKEHREWLGIIANFLWTIITLGANRRWDFFALTKTDSQKKLDAFEASFEKQNLSAPAA